jgi:ferredoxin
VATEQALATLVGDEQISRYWVVRSYSNTNGGLVKVRIDPEICQGQGRCFSIAPSIFDFDDLGNGVVIGDGTLNADTIALAQLAQANCPEHAIFIEE